MSELAQSFGDVAEAYDRGRPRYEPHVIAAIAAAAAVVGPHLLDVGAGTGRLADPLLRAGYDVVAIEPLDGMRAILARTIGAERALTGRAEALPLADASVDGAVCSDAWHWFDGPKAAEELQRVLRPDGGVVICFSLPDEERALPWAAEAEAVLRPLWKAVDHPSSQGIERPSGLDGHRGFEPLERRRIPFVHHTDREGILAHVTSMSPVATLAADRRVALLDELDAILRGHGVRDVDVPYIAELWVTRRRRDRAPREVPVEAAS
jgi:SAM-dependent methyltransferase